MLDRLIKEVKEAETRIAQVRADKQDKQDKQDKEIKELQLRTLKLEQSLACLIIEHKQLKNEIRYVGDQIIDY